MKSEKLVHKLHASPQTESVRRILSEVKDAIFHPDFQQFGIAFQFLTLTLNLTSAKGELMCNEIARAASELRDSAAKYASFYAACLPEALADYLQLGQSEIAISDFDVATNEVMVTEKPTGKTHWVKLAHLVNEEAFEGYFVKKQRMINHIQYLKLCSMLQTVANFVEEQRDRKTGCAKTKSRSKHTAR